MTVLFSVCLFLHVSLQTFVSFLESVARGGMRREWHTVSIKLTLSYETLIVQPLIICYCISGQRRY